jgi:hypothetical protein
MFKYNKSDQFIKSGNFLFSRDDVSSIDCSDIENLRILIKLKTNEELIIEDLHALEFIMQVKPSMLEGKRLAWPKFVWFIHNMFAHPLTQIFALCKLYKIAFWIHDVTIPKPLGKKKK